MNLNVESWKLFYLKDICKITNGNKLDYSKMTFNNPTINFVGRSVKDNGVNGIVDLIDKIKPYKAGCITVALGGSIGSSYVQEKDFYTSQNVAVLEFANNVSNDAKIFITTMIMNECKYKYYPFGRELNVHIKKDFNLNLPILRNDNGEPIIDEKHNYSPEGYIPDWHFMEQYVQTLHHKRLVTNNKPNTYKLDVANWKEFKLSKYFDIIPGKYHYPDEYDSGDTPYYSASNENNGISLYINIKPDFEGNVIGTGKIGSTAFYIPTSFCASSDVNIYVPKFKMTKYIGLFIATIINFSENYKWAYGRQCRVGNSKKIVVKLPAKNDGSPDWDYMENYMKTLPFGDRI